MIDTSVDQWESNLGMLLNPGLGKQHLAWLAAQRENWFVWNVTGCIGVVIQMADCMLPLDKNQRPLMKTRKTRFLSTPFGDLLLRCYACVIVEDCWKINGLLFFKEQPQGISNLCDQREGWKRLCWLWWELFYLTITYVLKFQLVA